MPRFSRRGWLRALLALSPALAAGYGFGVEPRCLRTRHLRLSASPSVRFAYFADLHFKGTTRLLDGVVERINRSNVEFALFGGDVIEEAQHLPGALLGLQRLRVPLYGVPGNHDYWSGVDFSEIQTAFHATGGAWLVDTIAPVAHGKVLLAGHSCTADITLPPEAGRVNVALVHYPSWADRVAPGFNLILAGHSHGGQIRLPFLGALVKPSGVGRYELGRFQTASGPLYVTAGVGTFFLNIRFLCPPELVVVEL